MSLKDARMPRLIDKLEAKAVEVQDTLEKKDEKNKLIIKKSAKKK